LPSFNDQVLEYRITALVGFQADVVVNRVAEPLLTSEVAFRCLYRNMPKKKLNLLKFTASLMTKTGASPPEIVRG
jgi:hypothetical protein